MATEPIVEPKLKGLNCEDFVKEFIEEYIELGFGILSKRDLEVLLFHLLYKNGYFGSTPSFFQISRELKISERRVRNLYQDVQLRYHLYSEDEAKERMVKVIEDQRFEVETINERLKYRFQIREPLLRQYMEEWVDRVKGITDTSFSPTIVVISREVFLQVLEVLSPDAEEIKARIEAYNAAPETVEIDLDVDLEVSEGDSGSEREIQQAKEKAKKSLLDQFLEKYIDTIAEESVKTTLTLAATGLRILLGLAIS